MKKNLLLFVLFLLVFRALSPTYACDNTPLLVVYDPVEIAGGQWNLEVFVCFGSEESEDGFTLESTGGVVDIMNSTPNQLENPYNGNIADAIFSGGVLNYYYDNSDGSNYNDADGETGPCVDFQITVDADPIGTSFTMAGVNDGCAYTISDDQLTSEVTFTPPCSATQSMIAPGTITGSTENAPTNCNFRVPVFSTVKDNIIEVEIPCDGEYTFSTCGSSFNTWMAISYQCCFLPFASNDNSCGEQSEITVDLLAGTYYVLVEGFLWDDEGDYILNVTSSTEAVSINNIDLTEPQCSMNDAELVIHAIGDDPPFSFSIDGGSSFSSDSVFSNLSGGNYFVVVESQSGCIASTLFSINTNPPLILDSIQTTIAACNSSMGELSIFVSNGSSPYQYSIDNGSSFQSSNVFSSLAAGNYLISVVDANGCEVNSSFDLSGSSTPIIESLIINDASCGLATGQVQINASGIGTLSYSIDGISYQSSAVFNGLSSGYLWKYKCSKCRGCIADTSLVIGDSGSPTFDQITISASACDTSGSIEIIASGGAGPYMYSIDGGLNYFSSNTFSNLNSGLYTVNLLDDNLCTIDSIVSIGQLSSLSFDNIIITEPSCDPSTGIISANGSIEITASGGASTLNYSIDGGGNFQLSNTFNSLTFGAYQVVVNDGSCSIDSLISLSTNPGPEIDILDARDLTCGEENGFIAVKVLNPTNPDYIYEFDNGIESIQSAPTPDDQYSYDQLSAGIWNIIVSDGDGCIADTVVELSISPDISITDVLIDSVFCNQTNGAFTVLATSGNLPIEYSLMSDFSSSQGNGYFNGLSAGSYTVYLRDDRLCLDTITVNLSNINGVVIDSLQSVDPTCEDHNGEITIHVSEGTPPYFYSVDNGLNFQSGNYFSGLHDEDYEILVVDASGCVASSSITLVEIGGITLESMIIPLHCDSTNGEIILTATGGDNNYTFTIDNGLSQSNTSGTVYRSPGWFL